MDEDRFSRVYVQPEIEGYLDKKETGAFRTKTSRRWCWVQGSIFYQQKPQTSSSGPPGGIDVLDMSVSDVQSVRKVFSDATGTQFEIVIRKSQVYVCPSRDECSAWIEALQKGMAIKSSSQTKDITGSSFYTSMGDDCNRDVYSEISDNGQNTASKISNGLAHTTTAEQENSAEDVYSTPQDLTENVYSDISEFEKSAEGKARKISGSIKTPSLPPPRSAAKSNDGNDENKSVYDKLNSSAVPLENGACSSSDKGDDSTTTVSDGPCYTDAVSTCRQQVKQSKYAKKDSVKGHKNKSVSPTPRRPAPVAPHARNGATPPTKSDNNNNDTSQATSPAPPPTDPTNNSDQAEDSSTNSEDHLLGIFNAMSIEPHVLELEYVLQNEDAIPVTDLKTFLRQNDVHCRVSTSRLSHSSDPVAACKSYLSTLDKLI